MGKYRPAAQEKTKIQEEENGHEGLELEQGEPITAEGAVFLSQFTVLILFCKQQ